MIDRDKILNGAKCCKDVNPSEGSCPKECPYLPKGRLTCGLDPLLVDVIALLKEQEAVEPSILLDCVWPCSCGKCKKPLYAHDFVYCPWCGKKVKWDA